MTPDHSLPSPATVAAERLTAGEVAEWLDSAEGRLEDVFGLWVQGKRDSRWVAERLLAEGHIDRLLPEAEAAAPAGDTGLREAWLRATDGLPAFLADVDGAYQLDMRQRGQHDLLDTLRRYARALLAIREAALAANSPTSPDAEVARLVADIRGSIEAHCDPDCHEAIAQMVERFAPRLPPATAATGPTYEERVTQMADALHKDCELEWQAVALVDPGRALTMHMSDAHLGQAHDLVRRVWPELDVALSDQEAGR